MATWRFYGRKYYFNELEAIFRRNRWFFLKISGRRRIGKTALIQEALRLVSPKRQIFYVQLPDSEPTGLLSAVCDALATFHVPESKFARPKSLSNLAQMLAMMAEQGYIVVLDEFQYLNRKGYEEFCSHLQAAVDRLSRKAEEVTGGLIVLGSIHTEMAALLDDRSAPLYGRVTDAIDLPHLDIGAICEIIREHAVFDPERLLFLWTIFEGVPKFYRDCFERSVLSVSRKDLLQKIFFESSSPLRTEAENWFLRELRGRYDVVLKYVARHPGSMHSNLIQAIRDSNGSDKTQISGYLQGLVERYRLIEKKIPIFAKPQARKGRYYLADNFLQAWLAALAGPVSAIAFRPLTQLIDEADAKLFEVEGRALEKLVRQLYEERSRLGIGDFPVSAPVQGYWDRADTEIDLVAYNESEGIIRFISCKRSSEKLIADSLKFKGHVSRFLEANSRYQSWKIEYAAVAPSLDKNERKALDQYGIIGQDLLELTARLAG